MENQVEQIKLIIKKIRGVARESILKKLDLDKCERVADKLGSFSDCEVCQNQLYDLKNYLNQLETNVDGINEHVCKKHKQLIDHNVSHLQNKHKLVTDGHYLAIYMSIGMSLGVVFGLTVFDNIGLGLPIGFGIGIAIGSGLDADAKKKGRTI